MENNNLYILFFNEDTAEYIYVIRELGENIPTKICSSKRVAHLYGRSMINCKKLIRGRAACFDDDRLSRHDLDHTLSSFKCYATVDEQTMQQTIGDTLLEFDSRYWNNTEELFVEIIKSVEETSIDWKEFLKCEDLPSLARKCSVAPL